MPENASEGWARVWPLNEINEMIDKRGLEEEDYLELEETLGRPFTHLD